MKNVILALLLITGISYASAQEVYTSSGKPGYHKKSKKTQGYDPDRLILGGGFTAGFGSGYVNVGASPIVGYRITNSFSAGIGLGYQYYQEPHDNIDPADPLKVFYYKENIVYPNVWARMMVYRNFYVTSSFEYDIITLKYPGYDGVSANPTTLKANVTNSCLLMGAGFRQPLGGRVSMFIEMVYDVLQGKYSPYVGPPTFRVGFAAGL